jgi:O-antigen/teichoic acid export membrane protein
MDLLKKAAQNFSYLSLGNFITMVLPFIFAGVRIRYLGVDKAGFLILLESFIGLTFTVGGFGFGTAALRKIAIFEKQNDYNGIKKTLSPVLLIAIITGLILSALMIFGFETIFVWSKTPLADKKDAFSASFLMCLFLLNRQIFNTYEIIFNSFQRYDYITYINSSYSLLTPLCGFITIFFIPTMSALTLTFVIISTIRVIVVSRLTKKIIGLFIFPRWDFAELRSMSGFGLWAYFSSLSEIGLGNFDRFILTNFIGSRILPYYVIGQQMIQKVHTFLAGQAQFLFPMFSLDDKEINSVITKIEDRFRWFVAFVSVIIYIGLMLTGFDILSKLVSVDFANIAILPFQIACLQGIFMAIDIVSYYLSYAAGRGAPNAITPIINGALTSVSLLLWIPIWGVLGASLSRLWYGFLNLFHASWVMKQGQRFSFRSLLRPFFTPVLLGLIWVASFYILIVFLPNTLIIKLFTVAILGIISILIALLIEYKLFKKENCVQTLIKLFKMFIDKVKPIVQT